MFFNIFDKCIFVFCKSEEIVFFTDNFGFFKVVRTKPVFCQIFFAQKAFASGTVQTFIFMLVNVPLLKEFVKYFLNNSLMIIIRCSYKPCVINIKGFPRIFKRLSIDIAEFFRCNSFTCSGFLNFNTVFVCSGQEKHILTSLRIVSCNNIRQNLFICMSYVRSTVHIVYCRC